MSRLPSVRPPWFEGSERAAGGTDLVVFPYAGGNPAAFRSWSAETTGCRALVASLPGRGRRHDEPPIADFDTLVDHLVAELAPLLSRRFALFGHSLGAYEAFEVARRLPRPPVALFVSGANGPARRTLPTRPRSTMTDAEFVEELRRLGGTPSVVLDNPEMLAFLMPAIRADFALVDTYRFRPGPPLACPVHVLGGDGDPNTTLDGLRDWGRHTRAASDVRLLPGDHFFVHGAQEAVLRVVRETLSDAPAAPPAAVRSSPAGRAAGATARRAHRHDHPTYALR